MSRRFELSRGAPRGDAISRGAASRRELLVGLLGLVGCRRGASARPLSGVTDAGAGALRVVSITPSTTEAMFAVGAGERLVGRSRYCDYPPEAQRLPVVGGYVDPSLEAILAQRPDLVIGERGPIGPAFAERLAARGVASYFPPTDSFANIDAMILGVGERTGHLEDARRVVARMGEATRAVQEATANRPRPRVLLVFGVEPLSVAGPTSFADEMIRRAGGENVVNDGGAYPMLGVERVIALDPDVVVNAAAAMADPRSAPRIGKATPGWARVRAVVTDRVVPLTDESVLRPGPRIADGLRTLARAIHGAAVLGEDGG